MDTNSNFNVNSLFEKVLHQKAVLSMEFAGPAPWKSATHVQHSRKMNEFWVDWSEKIWKYSSVSLVSCIFRPKILCSIRKNYNPRNVWIHVFSYYRERKLSIEDKILDEVSVMVC